MNPVVQEKVSRARAALRDLGLTPGVRDNHRASLWLISLQLQEMAQEYDDQATDFISRESAWIESSLPAGDR